MPSDTSMVDHQDVGLTISSGPNDVSIRGNVAGLDLLIAALEKAKRNGTAAVENDGAVVLTIARESKWTPR